MNDLITVAKFSFKDLVKRKSFIISTVILVILIIMAFNIPNIIKLFKIDDKNQKIIISDIQNLYEGTLNELNNLGYDVQITTDTIDSMKEKIKNKEIDSGIVIERIDDKIILTYVVENELFMDQSNMTLSEILTNIYQQKQIDKLHLSDEQLSQLYPNFVFKTASLDDVGSNIGNFILAIVVAAALMVAIYSFAFQVSGSITIEKTSKIIETLVTSTSPKNIVLGKTIGIGLVGICETLLLMIVATISAKLFLDSSFLSSFLDLSKINIIFVIIVVLEFILGYFIYAFLYALIGSMVNKPEEVQSANTPVTILMMISMYSLIFTFQNPHSSINYLSSVFPFSSPFSLPFRYMTGFASAFDVIISILILILSIILIAYATIKIYSNAILNYGMKSNLKNIIKMFKQK
ncbi:MAG: ABC transporter permease [Bacilli bacterium]|nr:ABC transporter permease [Bacilli bacterium]